MSGLEPIIAAFILGLMGAGHCLGMCGGIASALAFAIPDASYMKRLLLILCYNLGRALSYTIMGGLVGFLGSRVSVAGVPVLKVLSGLLLVGMGLYLANWWKGVAYIEKAGAVLWRCLQPCAKELLPVKTPQTAVVLGLIWGWLPCGLVYSSLAYASSMSGAVMGALVMFAFALGTLPAILVGGLAGQAVKRFLSHSIIRVVFGLAFVGYGLWVLYSVFAMLFLGHHSMHH